MLKKIKYYTIGLFLIVFFLTSFGGGAAILVHENNVESAVFFNQKDTVSSSSYEEINGHTISLKNKVSHTGFIINLIFLSVVSVIFLFSLVSFLKTGDYIYLFYLFFLFFNLWDPILNLSFYDWKNHIYLSSGGVVERNVEVTTLFALFFYCLFTIKLLNLKQQEKKLTQWIIGLAAITAIYGCFYGLFFSYIKEYQKEFFIVSRAVIMPMSLIALIWVSYKAESVFKNYFVVGSVFYFTGALLAVVYDIYPNIYPDYFYYISSNGYFLTGILLEIICFTLALAHRVYLAYQVEKEQERSVKEKAIHQKDLAVARVLVAQAQFNAHFIFNSHSSLKYLIQSNQNEQALDFLSNYSKLIRVILNSGTKKQISLTTELEIAAQYFQLENRRISDKFTYNIEFFPSSNTDAILFPPILLYPFLEDLIWKKLLPQDYTDKELYIGVKEEQGNVFILMKIGEKKTGSDISTDLIIFNENKDKKVKNNKRINLHNKTYKNKITCFELESPEKGYLLKMENKQGLKSTKAINILK